MRKSGFTVLEMFAVLLILCVFITILLPSVQSLRENARRASCQNNLLQVGLAVHLYHEAFRHYPVQMHGTDGSPTAGADNDRRLSFLVGILSFIDQRVLAESIAEEQLGLSAYSMGMELYDDVFLLEMDEADGNVAPEAEDPSDGFNTTGVVKYATGGPEPFCADYVPWMTEVPTYRCPSDPGYGMPGMGRTNYAACLGDGIVGCNTGPMVEVAGKWTVDPERLKQCTASMRGLFVPRWTTSRGDVSDGMSQTIMLGEIATDLGDVDRRTVAWAEPTEAELCSDPTWGAEQFDPERPMFWQDSTKLLTMVQKDWARGLRWADGMPLFTSFQTINAPNSAIVMTSQVDTASGVFSVSSRHQGGVNVCYADGAVEFISDTIDCGDRKSETVYLGSTQPPGSESPFGVWGALGTRASNELPSYRSRH